MQEVVEDELDGRRGPINYIWTLPAVGKHGWGQWPYNHVDYTCYTSHCGGAVKDPVTLCIL
jgi:hypothetical protein